MSNSYTQSNTSSTATPTTTGGQSSGPNSTVIGINSQPYRSYLTDRNHFYHSASHPNNLTSGGTYKSTSGSGATATGVNSSTPNTKSGSRQSLHSQTSQQQATMLKSGNKRAGSSSPMTDSAYKNSLENGIDDEDEYDLYQPSACSRCIFGFLWLLAQIGLWGAVLILLYWIFKFDIGFAWQNDKRKMFNLHAFLMLTGFIFVNGQSMLIYKTYICCKKIYNKIAHAIFFVLSISLVSFGMLIIIQAQHITGPDQTATHFYSLHSWIGLVVCGLFALQFFFGFFTFLVLLCCERGTARYRARFLPTHVTFGIIIYMLATAACLSGLLQTARSRLSGPSVTEPTKADYKDMHVKDYNIFLNSGLVINTVGGCLIFLAILIPYLVRNFQRRGSNSFNINH